VETERRGITMVRAGALAARSSGSGLSTQASRSARISSALAGRASGLAERARITSASRSGETRPSGRRSLGGRGVSVRCLRTISIGVSASKGSLPVSIS